jgi:hypothetical protein
VWSGWWPRPHFPAVSDLYEPLESPELVLHTDKERIDESAAVVLGWLKRRGLTPSGWRAQRPRPVTPRTGTRPGYSGRD